MKYKLVAVGGTFDRFHKGHKSLLTTAFENGEKVVIGLTTEEMVREKTLSPIIDSYEARRKAVVDFLLKNNYSSRYELVQLVDPLGPLKRRRDIEAVVVGPRFSKEAVDTLKKHIAIIHCPIVKTDSGPYLSSTAIRLGHVSRKGVVYRFPNHPLSVTPSARTFLKQPLGAFVKNLPADFKKPFFLISCGDEVTRTFLTYDIVPNLSIIDFYVQRQKKYASLQELGFSSNQKATQVKNPAGVLTPRLATLVRQAVKRSMFSGKNEVIRVIGEEDLTPLLCILFAPLTSLVCYGQPNEGLVMVEVTESKKEETVRLLRSFTPLP